MSRGRDCALASTEADMWGGGMLGTSAVRGMVRGAWITSKSMIATPRLGGGSGFPGS